MLNYMKKTLHNKQRVQYIFQVIWVVCMKIYLKVPEMTPYEQ